MNFLSQLLPLLHYTFQNGAYTKPVKSCNTNRLGKVIYEHSCNRRPWPWGPRHCITRSVPPPKQQNIWTWAAGIHERGFLDQLNEFQLQKGLLHAIHISDMAQTYLPEQEIEFRLREKSAFRIF